MQIALLADPHISLLDHDHCGMSLADTSRVVEALIDDVSARAPELVVWMGDLTHEGSEAARQRFAELHRRLPVTSVQFSGNHDVEHIDKAAFAARSVPCARRQWWQAAGWNLLVVDTVQEHSPDDPNGVLSPADLRFVHDVAQEAKGPMLVLGHHPMREPCLDPTGFWEAVEPFAGTGVYIAGHSHQDRHDTEHANRGWHALELAGCVWPPFGYHVASLSPDALTIEPITVQVPGVEGRPDEGERGEPVFPLRLSVERAADDGSPASASARS